MMVYGKWFQGALSFAMRTADKAENILVLQREFACLLERGGNHSGDLGLAGVGR